MSPPRSPPEMQEGRPSRPTLHATSDTTRLRKSFNRISLIVQSEQFVQVMKIVDSAMRIYLMLTGS